MAKYIKTEEGYKELEESISTVTDPVITKLSTDKMDKTNPTGTGSFSMNRKAGTVIGINSHAEGFGTTASGYYSHAEGLNTTASGYYSHAEGLDTTASGYYSHAEGGNTTAIGSYSHVEGRNTTASGRYSHAEGDHTKASGRYQHAQGKYNIEDTSSKYADIIGNGTSDTARSNAATVDWKGNAWFAGDVYTGSTSSTNKDEGSKKLATEEYVNSLVPDVSGFATKEELPVIPSALPNPNALTFTGAVNATYDGSEAVSVEIPSGGTDISLGLTSAAVGQAIKVKAVDESGKPTEWEAIDFPSGGSGGSDVWRQIADITLEEEVGKVEINQDTNGNAFLLRKFYIFVDSKVPTDTAFTYINIRVNKSASGLGSAIANNVQNNNTEKERYYYCYAEFIPDVGALCWHGVSTFLYNQSTDMQQMLRGQTSLYKDAGFYSLKIFPNDGSNLIGGVGTTIKVWGVDA